MHCLFVTSIKHVNKINHGQTGTAYSVSPPSNMCTQYIHHGKTGTRYMVSVTSTKHNILDIVSLCHTIYILVGQALDALSQCHFRHTCVHNVRYGKTGTECKVLETISVSPPPSLHTDKTGISCIVFVSPPPHLCTQCTLRQDRYRMLGTGNYLSVTSSKPAHR